MSTDYGLKCSCGAAWITDNISQREAETFIKDIVSLGMLHLVMQHIRTDIHLSAHFSTANDLDGLLEFAYFHHDHDLSVIDEYQYPETEEQKSPG